MNTITPNTQIVPYRYQEAPALANTASSDASEMLMQIFEASDNRVALAAEKTQDQFADFMATMQQRFRALSEKKESLIGRMKACEELHKERDVRHPAEIAVVKDKVRLSDEKLTAKVAEMNLKATEWKNKIDTAIANESEHLRTQSKVAQDLADHNVAYARSCAEQSFESNKNYINAHLDGHFGSASVWLDNLRIHGQGFGSNHSYNHNMATTAKHMLEITMNSLNHMLKTIETIIK